MRFFSALLLSALTAPQAAAEFVRYTGPKVCARGTGDPHMTTYDGVKYDCQGEGDFIMSKSLDGDFELQGRYEKVPGRSVTTTQGVVLKTGYPNEPTVEITYTKQCDLTYTLAGTEVDLQNTPQSDNFQFYAHGDYRSFMFASGVEMKVSLRSWMGDCLMSTYLCIPEALAQESIVGILGSPDASQDNDFMMRDGTPFDPKPLTRRSMNEYCKAVWCVPSAEDNLFTEKGAGCGVEMRSAEEIIFGPTLEEVKCGDMEENTKCPWGHEDRLFRLPAQGAAPKETMDSCRQACLDTPDCGFYSFGMPHSSHPGVCMGCSESGRRETHNGFNFYAVDCVGEQKVGELDDLVDNANPEIVTACEHNAACIIDAVLSDGTLEEKLEEGLRTLREEKVDPSPPSQEEILASFPAPSKEPDNVSARQFNNPDKKVGSGSGDPHFKTWSGEKYDYHGECDLVLVDDPSFNNGQGLRVHIRTTQVKFFSYIEKAAVQIGDEVLEFDNDVENFLINGEKVEANQKHHKTMLGGFIVRRDNKAISIRLEGEGKEARRAGKVAKIDLHTRKNGFPAVIIDAGHTDTFKGSLGLLGDWATGKKLARDGQTEIEVDSVNAEAFALEWQVRDTDPILFKDTRFPQWPATCTPPSKRVTTRLGMESALKEAEEACAHWAVDKEDCIFDVMATRDVLVAEEGHIVHIE